MDVPSGPLNNARYRPTATLLHSGQVLVAAGVNSNNVVTANSELAVPATNTPPGGWTNTGSMTIARYGHIATLLTNGLVLIAGGDINANYLSNARNSHNPATGLWAATGSLNTSNVDFHGNLADQWAGAGRGRGII